MWTITFIDAIFPMIPYAMDQNSFNMVSVGKKRVKNCLKSIEDLLVKIHLILTTIKINARRTFESAFEKHWLPINILFIMNLLNFFSGLIKNVWLLITLVLLHSISRIKEDLPRPKIVKYKCFPLHPGTPCSVGPATLVLLTHLGPMTIKENLWYR